MQASHHRAATVSRHRIVLAALAAAAFACLSPFASARHDHSANRGPQQPLPTAVQETVGGVLETLVVRDRRHGSSIQYFALRQADGQRLAVKWLGGEAAIDGATVQLDGKRTEASFFVERSLLLNWPAASAADRRRPGPTRYEGTLEFLHVDDLERDRCELQAVLVLDGGRHLRLDVPAIPEILAPGMRLTVDGVESADALSVEPTEIAIESGPAGAAADTDVAPAIAGTTQVLVILIKFSDTTTEPFTQATVQGTVFGATGSVASYYRESSYGKHSLAGTVTPWLTARFAKPTTCDYGRISNEAMSLAGSAGYNTAIYQKFVYVFPSLSSCGWSGLGGGSQAWINQSASVLVIGHELGHTFGLGHSSSLRCTDGGVTVPVDGTCTRSEYGDPYSVMGNSRAAHFPAPYKDELGYFGAGQVKVHPGGVSTYTLAPLESPGGSAYAVKVAASSNRTYWLEWRQPIGFDAALGIGATGGPLVHYGYPSEWSCDTCLIDMTPATGTFGDAALPVGQTFTDATTRTSFAVLGQTATELTVRVTTPTRPTYSDVPTSHLAYTAIETLAWYGIAIECGTAPLRYCPDRAMTRDEMAAFLERAKRGPTYAFTATGTRFADVPLSHWAAKYIEQLSVDGITSGCAASPARFCPDNLVTRAQMAPFMLKGRYGSTFNPGTASGSVFADVPATHAMAAWIERLYSYGITTGCTGTPRNYCPDASVTRGQVAIFLMRAFGLVAPPL
jgi:hypothetical protein